MDQKQTVMIFSTAYLPFIGGAELAIKEVTDRISDMDFVLITARMRRDLLRSERIGNVEVYRVGVGLAALDKILSPFFAAFHVCRLARKRRLCLFWSVMVSYTTVTPVLLRMFGIYRNIPLLITLQEGDSEQHIARSQFGLIGFMWRIVLSHANHAHGISNYLGRMARVYGYKGDITVVPNGVDIKKFQIPNFKFQIEKKRNIVITVSRLVEKNGVDILIKAFAEVKKRIPNALLHIVGDGPLRKELEFLTRILNITDDVKFFGSVAFENVPYRLAESHVFVRVSRSEGLGTAFLEAMAMGIPIIGTPIGGIPDFLKDGETGLMCAVDDSVDLAAKIRVLLEDAALYEKLQKNGKQLVEEKYTWDAVTRNMKNIFIKLITMNV